MTQLSLRQLELFRAVMRQGTLTAAAQSLGITQPAASRLLRHAEDLLGTPLFHRQSGRLRATVEARALYREVDRIFNGVDYVQKVAADLHRLRAGRLHLAAIPSLAMTHAARASERFMRAHPTVTIIISSLLNHEVADMVLDGRADLGLCFLPLPNRELTIELLGETELIAVLPPDHPLCALDELTPLDLQSVPLISFSGSMPIGQRIETAFAAAGVVSPMAVEVSSTFVACAFVQAGTGVALVDRLAADCGAFPLLEKRLVVPRLGISTALVTVPGQKPSRIAADFMAELRAN
ncbi:LysR family transcriptional regulator [Hoeflea marina]|uniref:LysR family transcriptional regulator n=1 Tax=Hoeflea marina TaxID=274592 RepID=A0A317PJZ4_9HYPH|nr:LysR family transcriptional regulator [Hoeflea marina]PWW00614.1 LysR family transcriptional regulator [Hoeflea marina]